MTRHGTVECNSLLGHCAGDGLRKITIFFATGASCGGFARPKARFLDDGSWTVHVFLREVYFQIFVILKCTVTDLTCGFRGGRCVSVFGLLGGKVSC